ncbi:DUF4326 domain-containing protein [Azospirillum argentinense]
MSFSANGSVTMADSPQRIQRRRSKGWRMPANTVYVGRGSRWGNPCAVGDTVMMGADHTGGDPKIGQATAEDAVLYFRKRTVPAVLKINRAWLEPLRGKNLACWCKPDQPCHADVLLELANQPQAQPSAEQPEAPDAP